MKKIKYCCKNFKKLGSKSVYKAMKKAFPELKHKKRDCLGACKMCSKQCFVMLGKTKLVAAHTPERLYGKLAKLIG
ncbi:DUF1450 domain-containing protein [Paenibacillus cremeus]|uniref:DUF1450 domain-containing protein n=1 Tax=Paenibacillus cremeus TaxID=2163881 RepID=A0A559KCB4_9BACL|nr:DUF1450 domain-containing protein [Paenibacillus cremeus]TVY09772.1 DUF1450 domain-containing protein [Paenibacillus cremeus]